MSVKPSSKRGKGAIYFHTYGYIEIHFSNCILFIELIKTHRKIIVMDSCPNFPSQGNPDEGAGACSLAARRPAKVAGEDVFVTKFRLQVAGRTLGGRIKAPRGWPLRKSQELKSGLYC